MTHNENRTKYRSAIIKHATLLTLVLLTFEFMKRIERSSQASGHIDITVSVKKN